MTEHGGLDSKRDQSYNNANYPEMIKLVRALNGPVLSPDDPTITLFATGQLDRSLDSEAGAYGMPHKPPRPIIENLQTAEWIIRLNANIGSKAAGWMRDIGFARTRTHDMPFGYTLWHEMPPSSRTLR